jgi:predicted transposase YbfD/YdcC
MPFSFCCGGHVSPVLSCFFEVPDYRQRAKILYPLPEILLLTLCAIISGAESWEDIEIYGESKADLLRQFLPYANGFPGEVTLHRVFSRLDPDRFRDCFISFVSSMFPQAGERLIAIDGKTSRGSAASEKGALHTVSAYATEARLVLAQVAAEEKSNEITAIPKLLELLDLGGAVVTADAAGCQKNICGRIIEKGGDYVISLKGNQGTLHGCAKALFASAAAFAGACIEGGSGHGRGETRRCDVLAAEDAAFLRDAAGWPGLKSVARITAFRTVKEKTTAETRFYVSSLPPDAERIAAAARGHWAIENSLHWILDVAFNEDGAKVRKDHAPFNLTVMRHIALNLVQAAKKKGQSVRHLRKKAGWDDQTFENILNAGNS